MSSFPKLIHLPDESSSFLYTPSELVSAFKSSVAKPISLTRRILPTLVGSLLLVSTIALFLVANGFIHAPWIATSLRHPTFIPPRRGTGRRNLIMMVSDGFGPASETFGRTMFHHFGFDLDPLHLNASNWGPVTPLDQLLVGSSRTRSSSSLVTDSAAGATAFSCAQKTYNGAISVTDDLQPCATVFEAAKLSGYKTGLVVTSRITHATPASFNAHSLWRDYENDIAEHQIGDLPVVGLTADLMFGGGRRHFIPQGHPESVREDSRDLLNEARDRGFTILTTRNEFDSFKSSDSLPVLGLFTPDHMSYNIDRDPSAEPSLEEMTQSALSSLYNATLTDPDSPGFFIMIEGSRIDMAAHSNDPGTHAGEILHYYKVIQAVRDFIDQCPDNTVMVSTSDHETGGLSLAHQSSAKYPEYLWKPDAVAGQTRSTIKLAGDLMAAWENVSSPDERATILTHLVAEYLNITDLSNIEAEAILNPTADIILLDTLLASLVSVRAQLGWSSHGHSGVDVNLYAYGPGSQVLRGNHENTDVGVFLQQYLGVQDKLNSLNQALRREIKFKHPGLPPKHDGPSL